MPRINKPNYQNSRLYQVVSASNPGINYKGSTTQSLASRMAQHRSDYKNYLQGNGGKYLSSFEVMKFPDAKIELIEYYPCNTGEELHAREGQLVRATECVNKNIPGRNVQEWYQDNKDAVLAREKAYYEANKDVLLVRVKAYQAANKDQIAERLNAKEECECGRTFRHQQRPKHEKSELHKQFIREQAALKLLQEQEQEQQQLKLVQEAYEFLQMLDV